MTWTTAGALYDKQRKEQQRNAEGRFASAGPNPFLRDSKGRRNFTAISKLVRDDPAKARDCCRQAGEHWPSWCDTRAHVVADLSRDLSLGHR